MSTEIYTLQIRGIIGEQNQMSVLHFRGTGVDTTDTFSMGKNLITSFFANAFSPWLDCCSTFYWINELVARRVNPKPSAQPYDSFAPGTFNGTIGNNSGGTQIRPSVFLVPGMGTKSGGRVFMPSVPSGMIVNNAYQAAYTTPIDALFTILKAGWTSSSVNWELVVYSRKLATADVFLAWQLSPAIGFQKRSKRFI